MGIIALYNKIDSNISVEQPHVIVEPEVTFAGRPIVPDSKIVTLAEFDVNTKNAITAHHLKDYRRKSFHLALLPKIDILFDKLLEGSDYWNELLHNESPYS